MMAGVLEEILMSLFASDIDYYLLNVLKMLNGKLY